MTTYTAMSYRMVARDYNAINALPSEAARQVGAAIARSVEGARLLDLGAGAGRLGIPAAQAGCQVFSVDLEAAMLRAGRDEAERSGVHIRPVQADALRLPLRSAVFDAVMINNLLHLVPNWPEVLVEAARVMRPGGVLIQGRDWLDPHSCAGKLRARWREIVAELDPGMRPTSAAGPALMQTLARMGGRTTDEVVAAEWTEHLSPAGILQAMRARRNNETWAVSDAVLDAGWPLLFEWAQRTFADLHAAESVTRRFVFSVTHGLSQGAHADPRVTGR